MWRRFPYASLVLAIGCYAGHEPEGDSPDGVGDAEGWNDAGPDGDRDGDGESGGDADGDSGGDLDGERDGDADEAADAALDSDPAGFVEMAWRCDGRFCEGANLVLGGGSANAGCTDLQSELEIEIRIGNCGTVAIDQGVRVVVRIADPAGRDIAAETIPAGMPSGRGYDVLFSIPWVEWRPRPDETPVFLLIDPEGAVEECNEEDGVGEVTLLGC